MTFKKNAASESDSVSSLDFVGQMSQCWWCIPNRTTLFILGYVNLVINLTLAMFLIPVSIDTIVTDSMGKFLHAIILEYASKVDVDFISIETFQSPLVAVVSYSTIKILIVALNIGCLIGVHVKKLGPLRFINGLNAMRIAYALYAAINYQLNHNQHEMFSMVLKAFEIGFASYFAVQYYYYGMKLNQETLNRQSVLSIEQIYIQYPVTDKEKLVV